MTLAEFKFF